MSEQVKELLYQMLETEMGGVAGIYTRPAMRRQ